MIEKDWMIVVYYSKNDDLKEKNNYDDCDVCDDWKNSRIRYILLK